MILRMIWLRECSGQLCKGIRRRGITEAAAKMMARELGKRVEIDINKKE